MVLTSWLNFFRRNRRQTARPRPATGTQHTAATAPELSRLETLEDRALLSAVAFDALSGQISFSADSDVNDDVEVQAVDATHVSIQVAGGDVIALQGDAVGNPAFVLSTTNTPDDTLTIDLSAASAQGLDLDLGNGTNQLLVDGITIGKLTVEHGGTATLNDNSVGAGGVNVQAQTIHVTESLKATAVGGGDVVLTTGVGGSISIDSTVAGEVSSAGGNVKLTADIMSINSASTIRALNAVEIQAADPARHIALGSPVDNTPGFLELSADELDTITADVLRIGSASSSGNTFITLAITLNPAQVDTLSLITNGGVANTPAGTLSVDNLRVSAGTGIILDQNTSAYLQVDQIALHTASGDITYVNQGDLTVGTVDGVSGLSNINDSIVVGAWQGSLLITDTPAAHDVDAGTGPIILGAFGGQGLTLQNGADVYGLGGIQIIGNQQHLDGTLTATGGLVMLTPAGLPAVGNNPAPHVDIDLGGVDSSSQLGIDDDELDRIDAATILVGDSGDYDTPNIAVTGAISPQHATMLLLTGNQITQQGGTIQAPSLALRSLIGAGNGTPLATQVSQLAFYNQASGNVNVDNTGALTVTSLDGLAQSVNLGGGVSITTHSPLTIATSMSAGGDIALTAGESIDAGDDLTINSGVTVLSTVGNITARAGDTVTQSGTLTVQLSGKMITLSGGDQDLDGFGAITLNGDLNTFDSSPQLFGNSGSDTITINRANGQAFGGTQVGMNIDAGAGVDHYVLNFNAGPFTRDIAIDDASGTLDTLQVKGTESDDEVSYDTTGIVPQITMNDRTVFFNGLETVDIDGRDAQQDLFHIVENVAGFTPPGAGSVNTSVPLTYSNFENISIANTLPTLSNLVVSDSDEGGTATLTGQFDDADAHFGQTFTLHIDWGDGSPVQLVPVQFTTAAQTFSVDHSYVDDNPSTTSQDLYQVSVTVTDDNGGDSTASTASALVNNVNPTLNVITFSTASNEGGEAVLSGTYGDVGTADTHVITIDWDDGTPLQTLNVSGGTFMATHVYLDDEPSGTPLDLRHPIVTIQDDDTGTATSPPQILVHNLAPQIDSLAITEAVIEGGTATLTGTYSDPGPLDTHVLIIDWGDGTQLETVAVSGGAFSIQHVYANQPTAGTTSGSFTIAVTLRDDDGGEDSDTVSSTVSNAAPVLTDLSVTQAVAETYFATLTGTYTDAGVNDTHTLDIDWGDGSAIETVIVSGGTFSVDHQYMDDNPSGTQFDSVTIQVTLHDGDQGSTTGTAVVQVVDLSPEVSNLQLSQSTINEGDTVTLTGDYTDPGPLDTHELRINWNDGSPIEIIPISGGHFSVTHQYLDDPPANAGSDQISIGVAVRDDDLNGGTASIFLTINNIAPTATIDGAPSTVTEGTPINLTSTVVDPGTEDVLTYAWTVTKNGNTFTTGSSANFSFTPDDAGTYVVFLVVTDDDNGTVTATPQTIDVTEVAPTVSITGPSALVLGQPGEYTLTATDPGGADQAGNFTFKIDWDNDGTVDQTVVAPSGTKVTHEYITVGAKTISVTATDKDGQVSGAQTLAVTVSQFNTVGSVISVGGTTGKDKITVQARAGGQVEIFLNGTSLGRFTPNSEGGIKIYGGDGNDKITVDEDVTVPVELYGQAGDDTLLGGSGNDLLDGGTGKDKLRGRDGNDILVGGDGDDFLSAGRGTDILIGGLGKDRLYGYQGGELLVGGTTSHDGNATELKAIRNEWTAGGALETRVANLTNGGGANGNVTLQIGVNVPDDNIVDTLYGETGNNWFLSFLTDKVLGKHNPRNRIR